MSNIWFTSDTHYGHVNIIEYCRRPFLKDPALGYDVMRTNLDVEAMNETMIENWNKTVRKGDHVYHLGDFAMGSDIANRVAAIRKRLAGEITLILGNHDRGPGIYRKAGFERVMRSYIANDGKHGLVHMRHRPPVIGDSPLLELCGHVHEKWRRRGNVINVGVDVWNFTPVNLDTLLAAPDSL